jgi:hypothetical protein
VVRGFWPVCLRFFLTNKVFVECPLNRIFSILRSQAIGPSSSWWFRKWQHRRLYEDCLILWEILTSFSAELRLFLLVKVVHIIRFLYINGYFPKILCFTIAGISRDTNGGND